MPKLTKKAIHHGRDGTDPNYRKALLLKMKRLTDYGEHSTFKRQGENMNCEKIADDSNLYNNINNNNTK